jgi:hypothetical protein
MAARLNAKLAAAKTKERIIELELIENLALEKRQSEKITQDKFNRKKTAQEKNIISAGINGDFKYQINEDLCSSIDLIKRGFEIQYMNTSDFKSACNEVDAKNKRKEEEHRSKLDKSRVEFSQNIKKLVDQFLDKVAEHPKFKGMSATREMVLKEFKEKIVLFKELIYNGEFPGDLYSFVFDSKLYLYQPIPDLKPILNKIEERICSRLGFINNSGAVSVEKYLERPNLEEYTTKLKISDADVEVIEIKNDGDYFLINWANCVCGVEWEFDDLFSATALCWLASSHGKIFFELIENSINQAIGSGVSSVDFVFEWLGSGYKFNLSENLSVPYPDQFAAILKLLGYKVSLKQENKSRTLVAVSWRAI